MTCCSLSELQGGDAARNAEIVREVLSGRKGPRRDVVLLNSAFALTAAGHVPDIPTGIREAARAIDAGQAEAKLEGLIRLTNEDRIG
jgi:anthranilate phosphoribosyltransferase